jgi:hypothetical protein
LSPVVGSPADAFRVAAEFLAERDRHGVLQMGAAGLQHVHELDRLAREAVGERAGGGDQWRGAEEQRQTRGRREHVVRRLAHVDVIVRVDATIAAPRLAQPFARAIREHLVRVHVVRGAGAGLVDIDHELIAQLAGEDLVRRRENRVGHVARQAPESGVGLGRGFLDEDGRGHEIRGRAQAADRKVFEGARGLHTVVRVVGDVQFSEGVALCAETHSGFAVGAGGPGARYSNWGCS